MSPNPPTTSSGSSTALTIAIAAGVGLGVLGLLFLLAATIVWRRQKPKDTKASRRGGADGQQSLPYDRTVSTPSTLVGGPSTEKFIYNRANSSASSYSPKTRSPLASRDSAILTPADNLTSNRYQRRPSLGQRMNSDSIPLQQMSTTPTSSSPLNPYASLQPQGTPTSSSVPLRPDSFFGTATLGVGIDAMDALVDGMGSYASSRHSEEFEPSHANYAFNEFDRWKRSNSTRPQSSAGDSDSRIDDP